MKNLKLGVANEEWNLKQPLVLKLEATFGLGT